MAIIKKIFIFLLCFGSLLPLRAGQNTELSQEELFDLARAQLAKRDIESALISLRRLYIHDRSNANINFLMGAAYTEMEASSEIAIYHLKKALKNVTEHYKVGDFKEKKAPIHTYYYLTVALSSREECSKAAAANEKLKQFSNMIDMYFIDEAARHMQKCPYEKIDENFEQWLSKNEVPKGYEPDSMEFYNSSFIRDSVPKELLLANLDSIRKVELGVVTRELEYSTTAPLYGVQIGSNTRPSPISSYSKLKNVDVFIDKEGMVRYVVGHFSYKKQAESLLEKLIEEGYSDAFVVNVNGERKYSNELISFGNVNLKAGIKGDVQYFVQLGAFRDTVPDHLMKMYLTVDHLNELDYRDMTLMTVGPFFTYKESSAKKEELQKMPIEGIEQAFIVAFNKGKKIDLQEAINYTD